MSIQLKTKKFSVFTGITWTRFSVGIEINRYYSILEFGPFWISIEY